MRLLLATLLLVALFGSVVTSHFFEKVMALDGAVYVEAYLRVDRSCVGEVRFVIRAAGLRNLGLKEFWLLLPREPVKWSAEPEVVIRSSDLPERFEGRGVYSNVTFDLSSVEGDLTVTYELEHACLLLEGRGLLLTPLIVYGPPLRGELRTSLIDLVTEVRSVEPAATHMTLSNGSLEARHDLPLFVNRVVISFRAVEESVESVASKGFTVRTHQRYAGVASEIIDVLVNATETFRVLFGREVSGLVVEFYLPRDYRTGPEGFAQVPKNEVKVIKLNLLLLRRVQGLLETIALHELVHHYLFDVGVGADATWFHEGLAVYLSLEEGKRLGLRGAHLLEDLMRKEAAFSGQIELRDWGPGEVRDNSWYAAAYALIEKLFEKDELGMMMALSNLKNLNRGLSSSDEVVMYLSKYLNEEAVSALSRFGPVRSEVATQMSHVTTSATTTVTDITTRAVSAGSRKLELDERFLLLSLVGVVMVMLLILVREARS
ncbi:MAG: hypothetical protein NZ988_05780 [Thaumarchaeota archaeon]|nr:hypothetical protein [Candidatus Calditenuaceae archaeon]MDW8187532.1 hypothetical protein [Nitrososphaerota archaeon]